MEQFQSARDSTDELRRVALKAGSHLVLGGGGWRRGKRAGRGRVGVGGVTGSNLSLQLMW